MSRKTSTYARKRRTPHARTFNGAAWVNTIQHCASYGDLSEVGGLQCDTKEAADKADARVTGALESLMRHTPPADVEKLFDTLSHALGVATIRALQIEPDVNKNPAMALLSAGTQAMQKAIDRWTTSKSFGLDAQGRQDLPDAVAVYREILYASSPAQMMKATDERLRILNGRSLATVETEGEMRWPTKN